MVKPPQPSENRPQVAPQVAPQASLSQGLQVLVLTGGLASGKSTAARAFETLGQPVVDADAISHQLTGPDGLAMPEIVNRFGASYRLPDGSMNRAAMRTLVFQDPQARAELEGLLHPMVEAAALEALNRHAQQGLSHQVYMVPLWVETRGLWRPDWVRAVMVIDLPAQIQAQRAQARDGHEASVIQAILARQASRTDRLAAADIVLPNRGDPAALTAAVTSLQRQLRMTIPAGLT